MSARKDDQVPDGTVVEADGMRFQKDLTWGWVLLQKDPETQEEGAFTLDEVAEADFLVLYQRVMRSQLPVELRNFVRQYGERTSAAHRIRRLH